MLISSLTAPDLAPLGWVGGRSLPYSSSLVLHDSRLGGSDLLRLRSGSCWASPVCTTKIRGNHGIWYTVKGGAWHKIHDLDRITLQVHC